MAQPTQALPPWLTYSYSTYTDPAGALTTSTTILNLPLTYYGPSIPLGPDWTYGGLTSPASTSMASTTSTTSSSIVTSPTTALPTSTSATPSVTSSSSSATSASGSSGSSTSAPTTSAPASSTRTAPPSSASATFTGPVPSASSAGGSGGLSGREIAAVVCGIVAFLLLCLLLFCCWFLSKRRRARRSQLASSGNTWKGFVPVTQTTTRPSSHRSNMSSLFSFVGGRRPGEGSPRHSGEEGDSLLRESRGAPEMAQRGAGAPAAVWAVNAAGEHVFLRHSGSSKSHDQPPVDDLGQPLPRDQRRYAHDADAEESPLLPPRVLDPDGLGLTGRRDPARQASQGGVQKRVQIGPTTEVVEPRDRKESGVTAGSDPISSSSSETAVRKGNGGSARGFSDPEHRVSWVPSWVPVPEERSEWDVETGSRAPDPSPVTARGSEWAQPPLDVDRGRFSKFSWLSRTPSHPQPSRASTPSEVRLSFAQLSDAPADSPAQSRPDSGLLAAVAPGAEGERPQSTLSARSGTSTVYHSATTGGSSSMGSRESRHGFDARPGEEIPPVPALPPLAARGAFGYSRTPSPPTIPSIPSTPREHRSALADILDMPAPAPHATFSSAASARPRPPALAMPPGLPQPRVWANAESTTASPSSAGEHRRFSALGDTLDAAPPRPASLWRSLADARDRGRAASAVSPIVNNPRDSLPASLHLSLGQCSAESLHSHIGGPGSPRAAGSVPLSTHTGSGSSRSQAFSAAGTSGVELLAHQRSVDEDGRRRGLGGARASGAGTGSTFGGSSSTFGADGQPGAGVRALSAAPSLSAFGFADSPTGRASSNPFVARMAERAAQRDDASYVEHT